MLDKLKIKMDRYEFLANEMTKPEIISDNKEFKKVAKEHSSLQVYVDFYNEYTKTKKGF